MVGESLSLARCYRNTGVEVRVIPIYPPLPGQYKRVTKVVLKGSLVVLLRLLLLLFLLGYYFCYFYLVTTSTTSTTFTTSA